MSEHALVPEPCRRPRKDGGLAQVLQRRTPSWGNRPKDADNAAGSRWRSQPGIVSKAEKSNRQRSKDWSHRTRRKNLTASGPKIGLTASRAELLASFVGKAGARPRSQRCSHPLTWR